MEEEEEEKEEEEEEEKEMHGVDKVDLNLLSGNSGA